MQKPTVERLLWDRDLYSRDTKFGPEKTHIIFVPITSIEGTPLLRGNGQFFWVPKPVFNLHSGHILALKT